MLQKINNFIKDEKGSYFIEFLIVVGMLVFLTFYPMDTFLVLIKHTQLEDIKSEYLKGARLDKGFTAATWNAMLAELAAKNFDLAKIVIGPNTTPVGVVKAHGEKVTLEIGYPRGSQNSLKIINLTAPDPNQLMWAKGSIVVDAY
jgi:hypothetical protein